MTCEAGVSALRIGHDDHPMPKCFCSAILLSVAALLALTSAAHLYGVDAAQREHLLASSMIAESYHDICVNIRN
jgi:hypothetical protein